MSIIDFIAKKNRGPRDQRSLHMINYFRDVILSLYPGSLKGVWFSCYDFKDRVSPQLISVLSAMESGDILDCSVQPTSIIEEGNYPGERVFVYSWTGTHGSSLELEVLEFNYFKDPRHRIDYGSEGRFSMEGRYHALLVFRYMTFQSGELCKVDFDQDYYAYFLRGALEEFKENPQDYHFSMLDPKYCRKHYLISQKEEGLIMGEKELKNVEESTKELLGYRVLEIDLPLEELNALKIQSKNFQEDVGTSYVLPLAAYGQCEEGAFSDAQAELDTGEVYVLFRSGNTEGFVARLDAITSHAYQLNLLLCKSSNDDIIQTPYLRATNETSCRMGIMETILGNRLGISFNSGETFYLNADLLTDASVSYLIGAIYETGFLSIPPEGAFVMEHEAYTFTIKSPGSSYEYVLEWACSPDFSEAWGYPSYYKKTVHSSVVCALASLLLPLAFKGLSK